MGLDPYNLARFLAAQDAPTRAFGLGNYTQALAEIKAGNKVKDWIWYIYPQVLGLYASANSRTYGITNLEEAREYLRHPVLGRRLLKMMLALWESGSGRIVNIMGKTIDADKLHACITLFMRADPNMDIISVHWDDPEDAPNGWPLWQNTLDGFYLGRDPSDAAAGCAKTRSG
ncbi:DUF1810-domain-containing protein [Mollisia scopiformis]|uniref:DUF1810-domain-containing protein n=1 Tax=Mollisia scopiformis TaxID=149040 RepID=A0A132B3Q8_MOLSC|nr:DUF1810-domain-containing protein [Mollisia scopiformis]KUJ06669.1 DUF1810-domain-containing protein [Mollisia scopiformis]